MKTKTIVTVVLLLFVAASVAFLAASKIRSGEPASKGADARASNEPRDADENKDGSGGSPVDELIVYYFHGNARCVTCRKIEAYAEEAVRTNFADEIASGKVKWRAVNVDQSENAHFIEDYRLVTRSLVLVGMENDVQTKWKNLDKVWQLVRSQTEFSDYVVKNTREFLGGGDG